MWRQIKLLLGIQLCNLFGMNQIRHSRDRKKRSRLIMMAVVYVLLGFVLAFYSGIISYGMISIGMARLVPAYVLAAVSLIILFFTVIKAGSILFDLKTYDMLISLPVKPSAIVVSRFLSMYLENMLMGMVVMVPAVCVYAVMIKPGLVFYGMIAAGIVLMPLFPMTAATAVGAVIAAVSSRMKHKNLVTIVLTMALTIGVLLLSFTASSGEVELDEELLRNFGSMMEAQIYGLYPLAKLFTTGVVDSNFAAYLSFAGISVGAFVLLAALVQWKFTAICLALQARATRRNYQLQELKQEHLIKALYKRELSRYFASSLYVMNTLMGYVLMVIMGIGLFAAGADRLEKMMQLPGIVTRAAPMLLAFVCSITPTTACAISIEGKEWWIMKSLPISTGQLFGSKMLVNLTMALPCYVLAEIFLVLALGNSPVQIFWLLAVPLVYILFSTVMGITANCRMPVFEWESEATVVKQSASMMITMGAGMVSSAIPLVLLLVFNGLSVNLVMGTVCVALLAVTFILYRRNKEIDLRSIE